MVASAVLLGGARRPNLAEGEEVLSEVVPGGVKGALYSLEAAGKLEERNDRP